MIEKLFEILKNPFRLLAAVVDGAKKDGGLKDDAGKLFAVSIYEATRTFDRLTPADRQEIVGGIVGAIAAKTAKSITTSLMEEGAEDSLVAMFAGAPGGKAAAPNIKKFLTLLGVPTGDAAPAAVIEEVPEPEPEADADKG